MARILIIDPEELSRFTMREMLESFGHVVIEAKSGEEGIALQSRIPFNAVVTDIAFSGKTGLETVRALKRADPNVCIVAVSGSGLTSPFQLLAQAERHGASRTLGKPFYGEELEECIKACLPSPLKASPSNGILPPDHKTVA